MESQTLDQGAQNFLFAGQKLQLLELAKLLAAENDFQTFKNRFIIQSHIPKCTLAVRT